MGIVRFISIAYFGCLTALLLASYPLAIFGIYWTSVSRYHRPVHFMPFVLLAVLVLAAQLPVRGWCLAILLATYACVVEMAQYFVPNRGVEALDLIENLLGLFVGMVIWWVATREFSACRTQP